MATFQELLLRDRQLLASFIASPKKTVEELGINVGDPEKVRALEDFARMAQHNLRAAAESAGIETIPIEPLDWGIGCGCCSKKVV